MPETKGLTLEDIQGLFRQGREEDEAGSEEGDRRGLVASEDTVFAESDEPAEPAV